MLQSLKIISAVILLLAACTREREPQVALLLLKTSDNPFFRDIESGVRDEWAKTPNAPPLHVRAGQREGDVSTQRQALDDYYARYVEHRDEPLLKAILLTPSASGPELVDQLRKLRERKVPVVLIDTPIEGSDFDVFIGSSNENGGQVAAQMVISALEKGGQVLLLNGVDGQETAAARRRGFRAGVAASPNAAAYTLVERTCNWRRDEARSTVDGLLALGNRYDAIFAANDEMALGAVEAYRQHPETTRPASIIGFDATDEARKAVVDGQLSATIAQDPIGMGRRAVQAVSSIWNSEPVERDQVIDVRAVKAN